ncbi:MAG TPA: hypothetical protein V6D29_12145 [Leptolyngbyaceae cyanobacterium]
MQANFPAIKPHFPRRFLPLVVTAGCVLFSSCAGSNKLVIKPDLHQAPIEPALYQAFEETCKGSSRSAEAFQIVGHRDWEQGKVVLYEGTCGATETAQAAPPLFVKGYTVLMRKGSTVRASSSGSVMAETKTPDSTQPIGYSIGYVPDDGYAIVEGQVFAPAVATIEARFDNGLVLQDSAEQGRFAIVASQAKQLCDLRVLDSSQQLIGKPLVANECKTSP